MDRKKLYTHIQKAPQSPGVYIFIGPKRENLYVGKASNIKNRISSYARTTDTRIAKMIENATRIKFESTTSDIEALILESQLIKKIQPPFNVMLRDDKRYFYVAITREEYPKIFLTHQPNSPSYAQYIGPFTEGSAIKTTLRLLRTIFPYCTCNQKHHVPCLNFHIGKCLGVCCLKESDQRQTPRPNEDSHEAEIASNEKKQYQKNIDAIRKILIGKKTSLLKELTKEMKNAAANHEFEKAIDLRTKATKLERIFENARIIKNIHEPEEQVSLSTLELKKLQKELKLPFFPKRIEGYDTSNIQGTHAVGSLVVFEHGKPNKDAYRKFRMRWTNNTGSDTAMLQEILQRRFRHPEWTFPNLIVIDGGKGQVNAALKMVSVSSPDTIVIGVTKDKKHNPHHLVIPGRTEAIPLATLSLPTRKLLIYVDSEAHRFAIGYYRKRHRRTLQQ